MRLGVLLFLCVLVSIEADAGDVSILASNGQYFSANNGGGSTVRAEGDLVAEWEIFTETVDGTTVTYQTDEDFFLTLDDEGILAAVSKEKEDAATFTKETLDGGLVALKSPDGRYLAVDTATKAIQLTTANLSDDAKFEMKEEVLDLSREEHTVQDGRIKLLELVIHNGRDPFTPPQTRTDCVNWVRSPWGSNECLGHALRCKFYHSRLALVITGPDNNELKRRVEHCARRSLSVFVISALAEAYLTGGSSGFNGAWKAAGAVFTECVAEESSASIEAFIDPKGAGWQRNFGGC